MKLTREQKNKICDYLEESLSRTRLMNIYGDEGEHLPLVDWLSTGNTIKEGKEEIQNIVEDIFLDMDNWDI